MAAAVAKRIVAASIMVAVVDRRTRQAQQETPPRFIVEDWVVVVGLRMVGMSMRHLC
jgi:hypothetical protein